MPQALKNRILQGGIYGLLVILIPILLFVGDARWQDKDAAAQVHAETTAAGATWVLENERDHAAILRLLNKELGGIRVTLARQDATLQAILGEIRRNRTERRP